MRILCFDPAGNFSDREGKGVTGWAYFIGNELSDFGDIKAADADSLEDYWHNHESLIDDFFHNYGVSTIVCESFNLNPGKAGAQSWSSMETPQLIGYMRMSSWVRNLKFVLQRPATKARVTDEILEHMGVIQKKNSRYYALNRQTNLHMRDAIRHGIYYLRYSK